ncbi:MAG: YggT family protein [Roseiflexus sp.]
MLKYRYLIVATVVPGIVEGVLIARLVLRLFDARPDNPVVQVVYGVTQPLIAPLHTLDARQPQYGASLEFSTLTLLLALPFIIALMWSQAQRRPSGS